MKKVRVFIERASDGSYSAYMPDDNNLSYGIIGTGMSIDETISDFHDGSVGSCLRCRFAHRTRLHGFHTL